jgi:ankyrin repeat protein
VITTDDVFHYSPEYGDRKTPCPRSRIVPAQWHALYGRTDEMLQYIREHKLDINTRDVTIELSLLHNAAIAGHVDTIRALIAAGANVDQPDLLQRTPLAWAMHVWESDSVRELLRAGAALTPQVFDAIEDHGNIDVDVMINMVNELLPSSHASMLFERIHTQEVLQHIIRSGVPTGPDILHTIIRTTEEFDNDITDTLDLFSDDDLKAEIDGKTAFEIVQSSHSISERTKAHLQARMWLA